MAAAAAVSMGLAAPGLASSTGRAVGGSRSSGGRSSTSTVKKHTFAGYSVLRGGVGTWKVSAHIVVPKVKCTSTTERAIDASVGVYGKGGFSSAGVFVGCYKGEPLYFLVLVVNRTDHKYTKLAPNPGDTVALHVFQSSISTVVSVTDKSRLGVKKELHGAGSKGGSGPWVGDTAWDNPKELAVPNFGKLHFFKAKLNGQPFGAAGGSALVRLNRRNRTTMQIKTGKLIGGTSFTTTFKHS
jgi:Peptidase A4 family